MITRQWRMRVPGTVALVLIAAGAASTQVAHASPTFYGICAGSQAIVHSNWPGIAEGTVGVCGTLTYHSTNIDIVGSGSSQYYRPEVWLQSGTNPLKRVLWRTTFRTWCMRNDAAKSWRWEDEQFEGAEEGAKKNTAFVQEYGPDVKIEDLTRYPKHFNAVECRAEAGGGIFFVGAQTVWNLKDNDCGYCETWQYIDRHQP